MSDRDPDPGSSTACLHLLAACCNVQGRLQDTCTLLAAMGDRMYLSHEYERSVVMLCMTSLAVFAHP